MATSASRTTFDSFDEFGRVTGSTQTTGASSYSFGYEYYADGSLAKVVYPSTRAVTTCYDAVGRPVWASANSQFGPAQCRAQSGGPAANQAYASGVKYAAQGAVGEVALGNGLFESAFFNNRLQPIDVRLGSSAQTSDRWRLENVYESPNGGNIVQQKLTLPGVTGTVDQYYRYDKVSRLTLATEKPTSPGSPVCPDAGSRWCQGYSYDRWGNRTISQRTQITQDMIEPVAFSGSTNRIADSGFEYTTDGDLKKAPGISQSQTYLYDAEHRAVAHCTQDPNGCVNAAGPGRTLFVYDGEGRRVKKGDTTFVYDAFGNLAAEYGGTAAASGVQYVTADHLGTTRVVTNGSGTVVERRDYTPFGYEILASCGSGSTDPRCGAAGYTADAGVRVKFTGKERDAETGLDYFGARYMSAAQGRFTSPDPTFLNILKVVNPQRWNLHGYAVNNPLKFIDPDGKEAIAILYPGYQVGIRGNFTLPLGHAGVVMVARDGSTHYFEYGRYAPAGAGGDVAQGTIRNAGPTNTPTPSVQRDASGRITPESMKALLGTLSSAAGKSGVVEAAVFDTNEIQDAAMEAYLEERQRQNSSTGRRHYSLFGGYHCGTLICEGLDAAGRRSPAARTMQSPANIFSNFMAWPGLYGVTQIFVYAPPKEKVTSKICYQDDNGKTVCQ